jgi:eukaryotic-like serine/threonine-protein kinase
MDPSADRRMVAARYRLREPLGRGGMGTVWRADDVLLGRPVAVKEVELPAGPGGGGRDGLRERALREARAAARLNHPSVVTLHDAVEADGRLYLVMELVEAPTLRELVAREGPLAPAAAARVGLGVLEALEAAHRAGIVHHDVKPANVMVAAGGQTKLADFGIASLQDDTQRTLTAASGGGGRGRAGGGTGPGTGTAAGETVGGSGGGAGAGAMTAAFGSLPYVAPEQAGGGPAGPAADLWALGATLWFAVEGVPPFERAGPAATLAAILHEPPGRPGRAGPLEPVLLALLDKDPARRPPAPAVRRLLEPLAAPAPGPTVPLATATLPADPAVPRPGWGQPRPAPRRRRPAPEPPAPPPGVPPQAWAEPRPVPRRRRWGRRLLVAAGLLLVLATLSALQDRERQTASGPPGVGDPVRDGQFEFVVRSVRCGVESVGQRLTHKRALEQFCLVALEVENTGREGRTFAGGHQYLFDRAGKRHDPDLDATVRHGGGRLLATQLNPGQRLAGTLVYDVPDPVQLARLELHDAALSGGVEVALA